jgi:cell fate regulator YaaT (PSP1 superfamily)
MPNKIIAVRLHGGGKLEQYDANGLEIPHGDFIVIETAHGAEMARAASVPRDRIPEEATLVLNKVLRLATAADLEQDNRWQARAPEAVVKCKELATRLKLPMKPMMAFYSLDGGHLTVYFTADTRIDFRDLVRDLRHSLNSRVELRQVGPRDEARLFGAVGRCGRKLCCQTFIQEFAPVSIRMAKDQELSLNPMKVSGVCGRLLCCLGYEAEYYRVTKEKAPRPGQDVTFPGGRGRVLNINALHETVTVLLENNTTTNVPITDCTWERRLRPGEKTVEQQAVEGTAVAGAPAPGAPAPAGQSITAPASPGTPPAALPPPPWQRNNRRQDRPRQDRRPGGPPPMGSAPVSQPSGNTPQTPNAPWQGAPGYPTRRDQPGQPGQPCQPGQGRRNDRSRRDRRPFGPRPGGPPPVNQPGAGQTPAGQPHAGITPQAQPPPVGQPPGVNNQTVSPAPAIPPPAPKLLPPAPTPPPAPPPAV